jgi:COP9 signalosome complex subunit 3
VDVEKIWGKMTTYLGTFDPRQIRYLGDQLSTIMDAVANIAISNRQVRLLPGECVIVTDNY